MSIPEVIPICRMEDLHTEYVGRCGDGTQFFINEVYVHRDGESDNSHDSQHGYLVLYVFDADGNLLRHRHWCAGTISKASSDELQSKRNEMIDALGDITYGDIAVRLFQITIDDTVFGLVRNPDNTSIDLQPGSQISFQDPWDGEYFT